MPPECSWIGIKNCPRKFYDSCIVRPQAKEAIQKRDRYPRESFQYDEANDLLDSLAQQSCDFEKHLGREINEAGLTPEEEEQLGIY